MHSNIFNKLNSLKTDEVKAKREKDAQEQFLKDYKAYMLNKQKEKEYKKELSNVKETQHYTTLKKIAEIVGIKLK